MVVRVRRDEDRVAPVLLPLVELLAEDTDENEEIEVGLQAGGRAGVRVGR